MLNKVKIMLGIADNDVDERLNIIIKSVTARLRSLLGGIAPPQTLEYIVMEVSIARFNRIGSEGNKSHSVDGESVTFSDDDFEPYMRDINEFLACQSEATKGKLRFV